MHVEGSRAAARAARVRGFASGPARMQVRGILMLIRRLPRGLWRAQRCCGGSDKAGTRAGPARGCGKDDPAQPRDSGVTVHSSRPAGQPAAYARVALPATFLLLRAPLTTPVFDAASALLGMPRLRCQCVTCMRTRARSDTPGNGMLAHARHAHAD